MFLEILQNSQENQNLFFNKVALEQVFSCEFCAISKNTFFHLTRTPDLLWKESRISMILMNVFVCSYSFVNITDNSCSFLLFHFCFKFYYPIVNIIVNHRYLVFFFVRVKPIQIVVTKHSDMRV